MKTHIDHLPHDLLLLMLNLAQVKSTERILRLFLDAMNAIDTTTSFWLTDEELPPPVETFDIATTRQTFGRLAMGSRSGSAPHTLRSLVRNAVGILAIVLENRTQELLLADENLRLESAVRARTAQLRQANVELKREIAERREIEAALRESEARLRRIVQNMPVMLDAFDEQGNIIAWNHECERVTGYSAGEIVGNPDAWTLLYPDEAYRRELLTWSQDGTFRNRETNLTTQRGEVRTIAWFNIAEQTPIPGWDSWAVGVDITDRVHAEQALQESHQHLEEALTQVQEAQEKMMQQERLAAVGQMAAGIAHDFNNVMATIVLYAQMTARARGLPDQIRERMTVINQQSHHATQLIQQILDFSRRAVLERWPMDLVDLLKNQTSMLARMLPENINLTFDYGDDDYSVYADTTRLQQVLANLAVNARDAMPQGGSLHFRLSRLEIGPEHLPAPEMTPGTWIKLTVADTGTGIPDDVLPHIFEPFFTTKDDSGSGLGLAQVYGIVAQHEGHIDVQTRVNEGTAFDIYLPALNVGSDAPTLDEHSALEHLPVGRGEQILVVEDETIVRRALVESLTTLNYRVLEATDGEKALEILQTHSGDIDLIFSDLIMPVMGGAELFQILQQQGGKIPIVLISGHPMDKERGELKSQGVTGWLRKPPTLKNLAKVAAEALSTDGQAREQKE